MENLFLNVVFSILLLELQKCDRVFQIKIIFCWTIISFICALISYMMLDWDINHHLLQNFNESYFPNFIHDA